MTQQQRYRLWYLMTCFLGLIGVIIIMGVAFQENMMYFMTPSELLRTPSSPRQVRLGGIVLKNSIRKEAPTLTTYFMITDGKKSIPVRYVGIPPDLFREGQGVIAEGTLQNDDHFKAHLLLAKHDENYMPPEIANKISSPLP